MAENRFNLQKELLGPSAVGAPSSSRASAPSLTEPNAVSNLLGAKSTGLEGFSGAINNMIANQQVSKSTVDADGSKNIGGRLQKIKDFFTGKNATDTPDGNVKSSANKGLSTKQTLGLGVASELATGMANFSEIKSETSMKIGQIADAIGDDAFKLRIGKIQTQQDQIDKAMETIRRIDAGATAPGQQAQQFIRDPGTGRLLT